MDFGWYGDDDIAGAVSFLLQQTEVDDRRIAAVGMSMGGEQAIGALATVDGLRAVVAEGATNRVAADKAWQSDEFGFRGALSEQLDRLTYTFVDLLTEAGPPISLHDAVRVGAPRPVLLIAAGEVPDEAHAGRHIQSASPGSVELSGRSGHGPHRRAGRRRGSVGGPRRRLPRRHARLEQRVTQLRTPCGKRCQRRGFTWSL